MLRIASFITSTLIWEDGVQPYSEQVLFPLLAFELTQQFEALRVTSDFLTPKSLKVQEVLINYLGIIEPFANQETIRKEWRDHWRCRIDRDPHTFGLLTFRSYNKDRNEGKLREYVVTYLLRQRQIQGKVPSGRRKRSSEDSRGHSGSRLTPIFLENSTPSPYLRDVPWAELETLSKFTPQERKLILGLVQPEKPTG